MNQQAYNYKKIEEAIKYIKNNFKQQPSLEEVAAHIYLSPAHFQKLFSEWAGTSPKKFLQYISLQYAKTLLKNKNATLFDTALETGLSGTSRLHDLFISIEGMTPAQYKNGAAGLTINYSFFDSLFGKLIVASTAKGVCYMAFCEEENSAVDTLKKYFPNANYSFKQDILQQRAVAIFTADNKDIQQIKLHLRGSAFQLKVWESLLKIPLGTLSSYGKIAHSIGNAHASRAVGTAIGSNPVAFLIPCHRVIQSSGNIGGYMWGTARKSAMIAWEQAQINKS